mmetsp:Transcript_90401/g.281450  ORF Transcript_90401/g.281450 Transcript_90401/m.281450 type:complete len:257 (-) Transcript_90401:784-1554(-)
MEAVAPAAQAETPEEAAGKRLRRRCGGARDGAGPHLEGREALRVQAGSQRPWPARAGEAALQRPRVLRDLGGIRRQPHAAGVVHGAVLLPALRRLFLLLLLFGVRGVDVEPRVQWKRQLLGLSAAHRQLPRRLAPPAEHRVVQGKRMAPHEGRQAERARGVRDAHRLAVQGDGDSAHRLVAAAGHRAEGDRCDLHRPQLHAGRQRGGVPELLVSVEEDHLSRRDAEALLELLPERRGGGEALDGQLDGRQGGVLHL